MLLCRSPTTVQNIYLLKYIIYKYSYLSGSCAYTEDDEPEWWSVELGSIVKVDHVIVLGRSDRSPEKIDGVSVSFISEITHDVYSSIII